MGKDDPDGLVVFSDVTVLRSSAPALLCRIGARSVWLPRVHITGKLWCTGDRGKLFIRRWVARDRSLLDLHGEANPLPLAPSRLPVRLRVVRRDQETYHAK